MYNIIGGDGQEYGPVDETQLQHWLEEGRANGDTQVREEGSTDWKPFSSYPELALVLESCSADQPPQNPPPPIPPHAAQPGTGPAIPSQDVPNYLVPAILVTICCCVPFGIVAIVYAAQVNTKLAGGDLPGAQASSANAKLWCWLAFILGLVCCGIWGALSIFSMSS